MNKALNITIFATCLAFCATILSSAVHAEDLGVRICEYVKADDKYRLRSYLKQHRLKLRKVYDQIQCNGKNLLLFAASNQSLETGEFIIGKIPSKKVAASLDELSKLSAHLAEEARERVGK